jgi:nanoRNase/pAp phosphatase (c-di-AMP/oligoRNAs hydrolase)
MNSEAKNQNGDNYETIVSTHGGCADGAAAMWSFTRFIGTPIRFYFYDRQKGFVDFPDCEGKDVYFTDCCPTIELLDRIKGITRSITVLDHHPECETLQNIAGITAIYDPTRCGCEITWDYLMSKYPLITKENEPKLGIRPWWFVHIRDRDLYKWNDPNSKAFSENLYKVGSKFQTFNSLCRATQKQREDFYAAGRKLLKNKEQRINKAIRNAELVMFDEYKVWIVNVDHDHTDIAHQLAQRDNCDFAIAYDYNFGKNLWRLKLRGLDKRNIDLNKFAMKYGGGGHPSASSIKWIGNLRDLLKPTIP